MKLGKRLTMITAIATAGLAISATTALASPTLTYYNIVPDGASNNFVPTNAANIVTIYGWQDTKDQAKPATEQYSIWQVGLWSNTLYGSTRITGNYPQSGQWYKYQFTGINPNMTYYLTWKNYSTAVSFSGAGNAYDGT